MKHSKLWTTLALPLMLVACSNADKDIAAGVVAPECMDISGEWIQENGSRTMKLTQDGCSSIAGEEKGIMLNISTVEQSVFGKSVRAEFTKTHIKIFLVSPVKTNFKPNERTSTIRKISDDVLEITEESALFGTPFGEPRTDRFVRVKPAQIEINSLEPTLDKPLDLPTNTVETQSDLLQGS